MCHTDRLTDRLTALEVRIAKLLTSNGIRKLKLKMCFVRAFGFRNFQFGAVNHKIGATCRSLTQFLVMSLNELSFVV